MLYLLSFIEDSKKASEHSSHLTMLEIFAFTEKWVRFVIKGFSPGGINLVNQYFQMALFGIFAIFTLKRRFFNDPILLHYATLPILTNEFVWLFDIFCIPLLL